MPNYITLVEDDEVVRRLVTFLLTNEGFELALYDGGAQARAGIASHRPDLVILDLVLPDDDGLNLCRWLRERPDTQSVPILALTARDQTVDKYEAYKAGFDGYIVKPFDQLELVFTIRAFLRLASGAQADDSGRPMGPPHFRLYPARFLVSVAGQDITLTRMETAMLEHLMKTPRKVFPAERLCTEVLETLRGQERSVDAVHAHIRNLRAKIEADPKNPVWIKTMGRRG
jgi:DNA-binding response OmpR family regulator